MRFSPDNKIKYGQDFRFLQGIPDNVDFKVEKSGKNYTLIAYGYGQLKPWDKHSYGNGSLHIFGESLTSEEKKMFCKELGEKYIDMTIYNRFSLLDI